MPAKRCASIPGASWPCSRRCSYDIEYVGKIKTALFGGEGLFFATLTGPGRVWLQSLPFSRMADRIYKAAPSAGGSRREGGSILGGLGDLLDGDSVEGGSMETQTYANHRHRSGVLVHRGPGGSLALGLMVWVTIAAPTLANVALLLLAYAAFTAIYTVRQFSLKLQDRHHPPRNADPPRSARPRGGSRRACRSGRSSRCGSHPMLSFPALMQRAIVEKMTADQIKRAITTWQADHLRT